MDCGDVGALLKLVLADRLTMRSLAGLVSALLAGGCDLPRSCSVSGGRWEGDVNVGRAQYSAEKRCTDSEGDGRALSTTSVGLASRLGGGVGVAAGK